MHTNMNDYLTSNFIKAEDLEEGVIIEARISSVSDREFEEKGQATIKPIIRFEDGRGVVLNQTRLREMIKAFGPNPENWVGKTINVLRGTTLYSGRTVPAVEIDVETVPRLEASQPAPQLAAPETSPAPEPAPQGAKGRGKITITSGKSKSPPMDDLANRRPDLSKGPPSDPDDLIPF
jgi:hypothetical protein